jgi:hypothetical protein
VEHLGHSSKEYNHEWYLKNKEKVLGEDKKVYKQEWYKKNKDRLALKFKDYYYANREAMLERARSFQKLHPEYEKDYRRKKLYGLSKEDYENLLLIQSNKCGLCNQEFGATNSLKPVVDHDHITNKVRAIIHNRCNVRLSIVEDIEFSSKAIAYLERFRDE